MSEPKKETVRIVLPPRTDGAQVAASPRENAMINLPPKPVPFSAPPAGGIPKVPAIPGIPKPPSSGGIPKPPSSLGIPKPPAAPAAPAAPVLPSATVAPIAPKVAPVVMGGLAPSPAPASAAPVGPAPIPPLAKKETAKVSGGSMPTKVLPQATVQFKRPSESASRSVSTNSPIIVSKPTEIASGSEVNPLLGIAALVCALVALASQIMMFFDYKP